MIASFSSLIEFFSAVYVTMTINSDFCENFWTPQYYKEMDSLLKTYKFSTSSVSNSELVNSVKSTYEKIQGYAKRKGAVMLLFCILTLVYIGFENDTNSYELALNHYNPLFYSQLIVTIIICLSNWLLRTWRWVAFWGVIIIAFYIAIKITPLGVYCKNDLLIWGYSSSKYILLGMLTFPILYQMILFWEFSSIYKGYLKGKVKEEYDKYRKSLHGIENGKKDEVDPDYKSVYVDYKIENKGAEDNSLEPLNKHLYERLVEIASPSKWTLIGSYLKFKILKILQFFNKNFQLSLFSTSNINISITPNDVRSYSACAN